MDRQLRNEVVILVQSLLTSKGCECIDVEWFASERTLRVYVDGPTGMTLDQCAEISRDLVESERLDELVEGEFNLEISSPGLDRPLRTAEHFRQQVGQKAKVELVEAVDQRKAGSGIITAVSSEGIIEIATTRGAWRFDAAKVDAANVIYQWPENNKPSNNRVH